MERWCDGLLAAVAVVLVGCGNNAGSGDASILTSQSSRTMSDLTGAHVVITVDGKVPNLKIVKLEGDVAATPAVAATATAAVQVGQRAQEANLIYVDGHLYSDIADPGKWVDYGNGTSIYDLSVLFNPDQGLANALLHIKSPKNTASEVINGVKTTKVTGTASTNDVAQLAGARKAPEKEQTVPITVWIADDLPHYLVKTEIAPIPNTKVTVTLTDFGKTVTATKPV